jgi:glycosyltransferase involved in cell wall biosynthesis
MSQSKSSVAIDHSQELSVNKDTPILKLRWSSQDISSVEDPLPETPDLICLSHLRWDFVFQRPQHLLTRCVQERRVFFIEEPASSEDDQAWLSISRRECGVWVIVPHLPKGVSEARAIVLQKQLLDHLFEVCSIENYIFWYYTPMALAFTEHLQPLATVYDCMDELSAFRGAPPALQQREAQLFKLANLVFTGGQSLYEAKRHQHPSVYAFPSSIDANHFSQARELSDDPGDQASIPHPRLGFYGVIDERMDLDLVDGIAEAHPDWHLVLIGPVVKIDPAALPQRSNIHYLGGKSYVELPRYLAGWDVALLPFARNESTRFISPTKTPEYLAAGKPVVSTSIRDVVRPYGELGLVEIADTVAEFVAAVEVAMQKAHQDPDWQNRVDAFLAQTSWDKTWANMSHLIESAIGTATTSASIPSVSNA